MNNYQAAQAKLTPQQLYDQRRHRAMNANADAVQQPGYQGPGTTFGARNTPLQQADAGLRDGPSASRSRPRHSKRRPRPQPPPAA